MVLLRNLRESLGGGRTSRGDYKLAETLLKVIREHAVAAHPADRDRFQALMGDISRQMVATQDDAELVMMAGAAQQALRRYEVEANGFWQGQSREWHRMVSTLTTALAEFGDRHSQAAERLVNLEHSLASISKLEDLQRVRQGIDECVQALRQEHRDHAALQTLVAGALRAAHAPGSPVNADADPVTGLDTRHAAEESMEARLAAGETGLHLALFVVHRIQQINARYGHAVGDGMLTTFLQHIAASVAPADQIFRWSGPAFLVLVQRDECADTVALEMRRIAAYKIDRELEIRDRSVMVPLSASVCVVPLPPPSILAKVTAELDQFASSHLER